MSEPQLWYSIGRFIGAERLSVGFEVRLGYNFSGSYHLDSPHDSFYLNKGFTAAPCLGLRWDLQ